MNIQISVTAALKNNKSGIGIVLQCDPSRNSRHRREMSFFTGNMTLNAAHINAIRLGLMSIVNPDNQAPIQHSIIVCCGAKYAADMLERNAAGWARIPKTNLEHVESCRNVYDTCLLTFASVTVEFGDKDSMDMDRAAQLAKDAASTEGGYDSGNLTTEV
jgi:hypothetical protein